MAFFVGITLIVAGLVLGVLAFLAARRPQATARSEARDQVRA